MSFLQRLRLCWRLLWYRGPWTFRYDEDMPSFSAWPPDVLPAYPAPDLGKEIVWYTKTPARDLLPRQVCPGELCNWKPIESFTEK